jgi:hypothetical protein
LGQLDLPDPGGREAQGLSVDDARRELVAKGVGVGHGHRLDEASVNEESADSVGLRASPAEALAECALTDPPPYIAAGQLVQLQQQMRTPLRVGKEVVGWTTSDGPRPEP